MQEIWERTRIIKENIHHNLKNPFWSIPLSIDIFNINLLMMSI